MMNREKEILIVWVSKYALTQGVFEMKVETTFEPSMVCEVENKLHCIHKPYWHLTREEAVQQADEMRIKKLKSLEKQTKKISSLKFD